MTGVCTFSPDDHDTNLSFLSVDLGYELMAMAPSGLNDQVVASGGLQEVVQGRKSKRLKLSASHGGDGQQKVSHIAVERNRRKQMNQHLSVLRSLMPCFYVKKGDQASIIGGVVEYITELQQIIQSLESKKRRKVVMSGSSPLKQPFSPMPSMPISPRTPQPITSPCRPIYPPFIQPSLNTSPANSFANSDSCSDLIANSRSAVAEVEVKFASGNLIMKIRSNRILGQITKVIAVLECLSLEVLHADISVVDETMVNCFTIKIGVECQLSVEEVAQHIQQTFG
ncbi:hypothetical protein QVD17_08436 [Tagetes erecta]|uniref:BHLH domain-containing protein n=1 Tax=Tagetes erecta TaxID=13708 RepID=A0AAD8L2S9_TARER|nr:hypothetical protein QVD17_08436 [Tagetes erecta]